MNLNNYKDLIVAEGYGGKAEPKDPGKLTVFGITETFEPDWRGWVRFRQLTNSPFSSPTWMYDGELLALVKEHYQGVWDKLGLDCVTYEPLSGCIFGGYVNQGPKVIRWLQEEMGLKPDKVLGPVTQQALADACARMQGELIFLRLAKRRTEYYAETADPLYVRGLVLRVNKGGA